MKNLIFVLLVFSKILLFADGVQPRGSGTETDPYRIASLENILWIDTNSESWDKYFIQVNDINASSTQFWNDGEGFVPIGTNSINFTGNYNGGNYSIDSLYINREDISHQAFFGYLHLATLTNINLTNVNISSANDYIAGLAVYCNECDIINCSASGIIYGKDYVAGLIADCDFFSTIDYCVNSVEVHGQHYVGGIVASCQRSSSIYHSHNENQVKGIYYGGGIAAYLYNSNISNCSNNARVRFSIYVGGIVGEQYFSTVSDCHNTGYVTGERVGGISGYCHENSVVTRCYNTGHVGGPTSGGVIGLNEDNYAITKCYNTGLVDSGNWTVTIDLVGGLIGSNYTTNVINCYSTGNVSGDWFVAGFIGGCDEESYISNCYSTGNVNANIEDGASGFVKSLHVCQIYNCFWDIETSGQTTSDAGGTGKTTAEMKDVATYTSTSTEGLDTPWDFVNNPFDDNANEDIWDINSEINNGYPFLKTFSLDESDNVTINKLPETAKLQGNYPNPFNPTTTILFFIPNVSQVELSIYNLKGQKIKTLTNKQYKKGNHQVTWDGKDDNYKTVASGVYFYKLNVNGKIKAIKKCMLIK